MNFLRWLGSSGMRSQTWPRLAMSVGNFVSDSYDRIPTANMAFKIQPSDRAQMKLPGLPRTRKPTRIVGAGA